MKNDDYDVKIDRDRWDKFDGETYGRLTLDGVETAWMIGPINNCFNATDDPWGSRFDLLINDARDFRSRADFDDIYRAVVSALQDRHHPHHCGCRDCDDDFDENQKEALGEPARQELRELGLLDVKPALLDDGGNITVEDVLGAPRKAELQFKKLGLL